MCRRFAFFFLLLLVDPSVFGCLEATAQMRKLREVKVKGRKREPQSADIRLNGFTGGMQRVAIDSSLLRQYALQQLSQLLSEQTSVFVRSYGINGVATLNFRGASSAQSQVLWNGVPLNSASVGATDVSLLSTNLFSRVELLYGGSSSLLGSGNVGGALLLDNKWSFTDSLPYHARIALEYGSFGQMRANLQQTLHVGRWMAGVNVNGRLAKNDFTFNGQQNEVQTMQHAALRAGSVLIQSAYQISDSTFIRAAVWGQQYYREIPAALFEPRSEKVQRDFALRSMIHAQLSRRSQVWYARLAATEERMRYEDSLIFLQTANKVQQGYSELGWRRSFGDAGDLLVFIPASFATTKPDRDTVYRHQSKLALAAAYSKYLWRNRIHLSLSGRAEQVNGRYFFLPGCNLSYTPIKVLKLRANLQRSYRVPTLNEMYFMPGGNPQLKPEQGWSSDAGWQLDLPLSGAIRLHQESSCFARRMHDWIIWFGGAIWTPHNIATVYSRGVETVNTLTCRLNAVSSFWIGLNTSFVLATTVSSYQPGDGSIGKQIPYSPRYNGQANIGCAWKNLRFTYNHTYTGYRFITVDESAYLAPYNTGNLQASWNRGSGRYGITLSAFANNLWNQSYQVVAGRPMPGRNVGAGMSLEL